MRMRQSLAELERAFVEEVYDDRDRRDALRRTAAQRSRARQVEKVHQRGTMRFGILVVVLLATAVGVTIGMFQILFWTIG